MWSAGATINSSYNQTWTLQYLQGRMVRVKRLSHDIPVISSWYLYLILSYCIGLRISCCAAVYNLAEAAIVTISEAMRKSASMLDKGFTFLLKGHSWFLTIILRTCSISKSNKNIGSHRWSMKESYFCLSLEPSQEGLHIIYIYHKEGIIATVQYIFSISRICATFTQM